MTGATGTTATTSLRWLQSRPGHYTTPDGRYRILRLLGTGRYQLACVDRGVGVTVGHYATIPLARGAAQRHSERERR